MADEPDPFRLVQAHCDHLQLPRWDTGRSDCAHCHEKFIPFLQLGRTSKHNCRLCGQQVCRSCTSKLHVAERFEKKGKDLSRVCHACLFSVLARRALAGESSQVVQLRVIKYVWPAAEPSLELVPRVFFQPEWANVHDTSGCFICMYITERRHHCRLCGLLFCDDCSQKMSDIPQSYDQKNKPGGKRVCDYCRFLRARGWRFAHPGEKAPVVRSHTVVIHKPPENGPLGYTKRASVDRPGSRRSSAASSLPPRSSLIVPSPAPASSSPAPSHPRPSAILTSPPALALVRPLSQCSILSCQASATVAGFCAQHDVVNSALPKNTTSPSQVVVRFRFDEDITAGRTAPCAQVTSIGHADLHALHNLLMTSFPALEALSSAFRYVVRGRVVQKMHWRMFEARFCVPEVVIEKITPFDHHKILALPSSSPTPLNSPPLPPRRPSRISPAASPHQSRAASPTRPASAMPTREQLIAQSKPSRAGPVYVVGRSPAGSPSASRQASPSTSRHQSPARAAHSSPSIAPVATAAGPPPIRFIIPSSPTEESVSASPPGPRSMASASIAPPPPPLPPASTTPRPSRVLPAPPTLPTSTASSSTSSPPMRGSGAPPPPPTSTRPSMMVNHLSPPQFRSAAPPPMPKSAPSKAAPAVSVSSRKWPPVQA